MPRVKSLSDFNRNQASIIEDLERTGEPLYLTRNGRGSVVVMDSQAFDDLVSFRNDVYAREMRLYDNLMSGYESYRAGDVVSASDADELIRKAKGWE